MARSAFQSGQNQSEKHLKRSFYPRRLHRRRPRRPTIGRLRIVLVWLLLMAGIGVLTVRLAHLQVFRSDALTRIARQQQAISRSIPQARRPILDRLGNVVAVDQVAYALYAHPMLFQQDIGAIAKIIAPILERSQRDLEETFQQQETGISLGLTLSEDLADRIRQLRIDGLELVAQQTRVYPQRSLFAPIVGFVNLEGVPQAGLELSLEDQLLLTAMPKSNQAMPARDQYWPTDDQALQLTLDTRLQRVAQKELQATLEQHSAERGAAIVMDVHNGEILAFAIAPTFDPNRYYEFEIDLLKNWAVSDLYEPGSTFKPINVAIALEVGAISPDASIYDEGKLRYDEWTIRNVDYDSIGNRGYLSVSEVLMYSSNVGMVHIMEQMPAATYFDWLQQLGIGRPTHIDLPAEAIGQLKERNQFINSEVEAATASFGQGFALTPIKLLQLQASLANGGQLVVPHVVRGLTNAQGSLIWKPQRAEAKVAFRPEITAQVLAMMEAVVQNGTGEPAQLPGYRVAGKTGTAQKVTETGVYGDGRITSFVGILPVNAPQYVVLAVIDDPLGDDASGSSVAAPLAAKLMESLVVNEGIPPQASLPN